VSATIIVLLNNRVLRAGRHALLVEKMEKDTLYELNAEIASCDLSQDSQYNASQAQRIMGAFTYNAPIATT